MRNMTNPNVTVLTISMSLLIVHFITSWDWPVLTSLITGVACVIFPALAVKMDYLWKAVTRSIGIIVQHFILILVYYLFLFPLAMGARLFSQDDPLRLSNNSSSTFVDVNKAVSKKDLERPW
jgi:hypothetical protein